MIKVIDTLESMGNYPVVKAESVEVGANQTLDSALNGKVDKVDGKVLSSNDYSNSDKTKLNEISGLFTKVVEE